LAGLETPLHQVLAASEDNGLAASASSPALARSTRQKRATCARPVLHLVADSSGVAPRWSRRA